jgi:hypothetical protein
VVHETGQRCGEAIAERPRIKDVRGHAIPKKRVPRCSPISNHRGAMVRPCAVQLVFSTVMTLFS